MNAIFYGNQPSMLKRIYDDEVKSNIKMITNLNDTFLDRKNLSKNAEIAKNADIIFTTWGMDKFSIDEINQYFPNLKYLFYGAGSVQHFAKEFLEKGIRVFSSASANAIPVAEYTFAQIILANKGMFQAIRRKKFSNYSAHNFSDKKAGNYKTKIGVIGVGQIGQMVCKKLKDIDCEILYYDPFLPADLAKELDIKEASLKEIFSECDCITNHLANKTELEKIFDYDLFHRMKPYGVFINTGRGKQVDEKGLCKAMRECGTRTAILDVTVKEPPNIFSPLRNMRNIILTPHIAGSLGDEVVRMGAYMYEECNRILSGENSQFEVTLKILQTMA